MDLAGLQAALNALLSRYPFVRTTMTTHPQKITFGEMGTSGGRDVLVYCRDHKCSHHITISAERWPDHIRLSDIEPDFVCTACGKRGAEIRPKFSQARMGTG
jgi:hypothetical protein